MEYNAVYIYKVKERNTNRFIDIHRDVVDIFRDLGARSIMYEGRDLAAKYGCYSFFSFFNCDDEENFAKLLKVLKEKFERAKSCLYRGCKFRKLIYSNFSEDKLYMGIGSFNNEEHFREIMRKFDSNKRVEELYGEVSEILDISSIIRGEFEQVI